MNGFNEPYFLSEIERILPDVILGGSRIHSALEGWVYNFSQTVIGIAEKVSGFGHKQLIGVSLGLSSSCFF